MSSFFYRVLRTAVANLEWPLQLFGLGAWVFYNGELDGVLREGFTFERGEDPYRSKHFIFFGAHLVIDHPGAPLWRRQAGMPFGLIE